MVQAVHRRSETADAALRARGRPGALCGRAGSGGGGERPLCGRGCARTDRGRVPRTRPGGRSGRRVRARRIAAAPGSRIERRERPAFPLRAIPTRRFARAEHRVAISVRYPRNTCTPIEGFVVVAEHLGDDGYDVLSNFQGPFSLHPVMARALGVRVRGCGCAVQGIPAGASGSSRPYFLVSSRCASPRARRDARSSGWRIDLEHLVAATSATNRVTTLEAAVTGDGTITALRWDQLDDCGAYLRAPEPASLYRTHGHMTGPYRITNLEIHNRVVLTNKTPTGLNRGFGGPQVYFALERLVAPHREDTRARPARRHAPESGSEGCVSVSGRVRLAARLRRLWRGARHRHRRWTPRPASSAPATPHALRERRYGIGFAAVVEPSISTWATSRWPSPPRSESAPDRRTVQRQARRWPSIRSARSRCKSPRCRRARATALSSPRSSPTCWGRVSRTSR